jgi:hypothetical protein
MATSNREEVFPVAPLPRGLSGGGSYIYEELDSEIRSEAEKDTMTIGSKHRAVASNTSRAISDVMNTGGERLLGENRERGVSC